MGAAWSSPAQQTGQTQNFDPRQQGIWNQFTSGIPDAYDISKNPLYGQSSQAIGNFLQPFDAQQSQQYFNEGVANPALKTYNEDILPSIKSQYYQPNAAYGSGLNQAISKSAENLTQGLGSLRANYLQQGQRDWANNQQGALAQALGLMNSQAGHQQGYYNTAFGASPSSALVQGPQSGPLRDILQMIASALGASRGGQ